MWKSMENVLSRSQSSEGQENEDDAVRWSSLERLPTHSRVRKGLFRNMSGETKEVSLGELDIQEQRIVLDRLGNSVRGDYEQLFIRMRNRFEAVNLEFPKIEIRFQNLVVESFVHVGSRALPTIPNFIMNAAEVFLRHLCLYHVRRRKLAILDDIAGSFQPSRLTLLLGPPGSGKTTLLLALAGRLHHDLQVSGRILYNTQTPKEVSLQRICAYVSQQDMHVAEMTVRETLMFAGYCQHVGVNYEMILELCRREKIAGIRPEVDLDLFMKALALGTPVTGLIVDHILKILGLDICANTLVGDEMLKGISGGQKKRLTTGELLVGPAQVLLMDDISTGLDSSTTYQIIKYLKNITHALDRTTIISLLQPAPETYELFDDVLLLCEGQIIFQGPRDSVLDFFASMGFRCPERKNVADFLQEVSSKKDQRHYWSFSDHPYEYVSVTRFAEAFQSYHTGRKLFMEPVISVDGPSNQYTRLSAQNYSLGNFYLLRTSFYWQMLLMKRNLFIYVFKSVQLFFIALITMSVFFRTRMHHNTVDDGGLYVGELYFSMVIILFNGFTEVSMLVSKLPVIYKHRELKFYPSWVYTLPSCILSIPISFIESTLWVAVTYFVVGFDAQSARIFQQFLLFFFLHQMSIALFRLMGSLGRNMIVSNTFGSFAMLVVMALGGYIISRDRVPDWWLWGFWVSPLMYAQNAASINELHGNSWGKKIGKYRNSTLGDAVLKSRHLFADDYWYWLGIAALFGYTVLFNILFTFFLSYLTPLGRPQAIMSEEDVEAKENKKSGETPVELRHYRLDHHQDHRPSSSLNGMAIPFQRLSVSFSNVSYFIDVKDEKKLQLLVNVSGAFRPGVLTALVGVSGAGKTTLMDVLSGRKTGGTVEGDVYVSGRPKKQETFARVCGYCEQNDVHSPCLTVLESLLFSAWLRLPSCVDAGTQKAFVREVMELVELTPLSGVLVGIPGVDGLSTEQRKRLTIAVELVANPSAVFMDEPTSGLDARSAAIVMRTVRNIADTGRTIVCTIHQPSIEIAESFDEILVMKQGGELVYAGELGTRCAKLISFFEAVDGVVRFRTGCNPCAWVLQATSPAEETRLGVDFSEIYRRSELFRRNTELVEGLRKPDSCSEDLSFPSRYSRSFVEQFKACLWKQNLSYWHNPHYTAVRFFYTLVISLMLGTICWRFGSKRSTQQDVANAMGAMYVAVLFIGVTNGTSVQPVISIERFVFYRERAAGMYSPLPFALAQIGVEFPYVLVQTLMYCVIFYSMASFEWSVEKFGWYVYFMYVSITYFTFYGMMTTAITSNHGVAAIIAAPFYMLWNLFSGFMIPYKRIPVWWRWYYWANPVSWTLYGLLCSQYGDSDEMVELSDASRWLPMRELMEDVYGFNREFLPAAALAVLGFSLLFAAVFSLGMRSFNFQNR